MYKIALCFIVIFSTYSYANAAFSSGNKLLDICDTADGKTLSDQFHFIQCLGFIEGFLRGFASGWVIHPQELGLKPTTIPSLPFCPPDSATFRQFIKVVVKYLNNNPEEKLYLPPGVLVFNAFKEAFPCPK